MKKTKKHASKKQAKIKKGTKYSCGECGMVVSVVEPCGCEDDCGVSCCGQAMDIC